MKKVFIIYLPIIILTLLISLPFIFPARLIALALIPEWLASAGQQTNQRELTLTNLQGAVSEGSGDVLINSVPAGSISWTTDLSALLSSKLKLKLMLAGDDHLLQANVVADGEQLLLEDLHGYIREASVNPHSASLGLTLEGELKLSAINLKLHNGWLRGLTGNLWWSGGSIRYRAAHASANYQLESLSGELSLPDRTAFLEVRDTISAAEVLRVELTSDGWATVAILRRFFDLAGKQWIITNSADDIALQLEQKLW